MTTKNHNIAIAVGLHLEKWSPVKIHIAKENGSIPAALKRRTYHKNGTAQTVRSRERRLETQHQEGTS